MGHQTVPAVVLLLTPTLQEIAEVANSTSSPAQFSQQELRGFGRQFLSAEEAIYRALDNEPAALQVRYPCCQALGLAKVMTAHDNGHTRVSHFLDQGFDFILRAWIQAGGGLVQEQDVWLQGPGAGQSQALLLTTG